ncbi:MAG TPA: baseplate J/gp47 family protein [Blastocatellia bacterium]|nr:baseplate J/gp47 family protein [Blastocatellia bacterium]
MALEPIKLDDLKWADMVVAIRRRIAAASVGRWTLHAAVDPGVTLLELFAWLLEQRLYWMDQVPDSLVRATLRLLGEEPRPARAASTVLRFSSAGKEFQKLGARTKMQLAARVPPLIFSTVSSIALLPVDEGDNGQHRISIFIGERDRTQDLAYGRALRLFPYDGSSARIKIVLWLKEPFPPTPIDAPFSLLFDLDAPSSIASEQAADAVKDVPAPAKIKWLYRNSNTGEPVEFAQGDEIDAAKVKDGTGGLRRSGVVQLPIPTDWKPENLSSPVKGLVPYAIWLHVDESTFTSPPRLVRLIANVAIARHARLTCRYAIKREWLPLPGNTLSLAGLLPGECSADGVAFVEHPPIENCVALHIAERDGRWHRWRPTGDFSFSGPDERVFIVDRERSEFRFGDGLTGRVPVLSNKGKVNIRLCFAVGAGSAGNLGKNLEWEGCDAQGFEAKNVVPATGGEETETSAAASRRVSASLKQRTRAITPIDYEDLAQTTPGVAIARSHAAIGYHPGFPCGTMAGAITVFIVPHAPRERANEQDAEGDYVAAPQPDPGALAAIRRRLEAARLVTSEVFVRAPRYRHISLAIDISAESVDPLGLRKTFTERLQDFLDPLIGGDQKNGWPFGEPVRPSALLREAQKALGDYGKVNTVFIGIDGAVPHESCNDVAIGPHDLVVLEEITVRLQQSAVSSGGLR